MNRKIDEIPEDLKDSYIRELQGTIQELRATLKRVKEEHARFDAERLEDINRIQKLFFERYGETPE